MCYSAQVEQRFQAYVRRFGADIDIHEFVRRYGARAQGEEGSSPLLNIATLELFSRASWFNLDAARRDLGYAPKVTLAEGMTRLQTQLARERMQSRG